MAGGCLKNTLAFVGFLVVAGVGISYLQDKKSDRTVRNALQTVPQNPVAVKNTPAKTPDGAIPKGIMDFYDKLIIDDYQVALRGGKGILNDKKIYPNNVFLTGSQLARAYDANEARADREYKGKTLFIKGMVTAIKSGLGDEPYIEIASNLDDYGMNNPVLHFNASERGYPAMVDKGQVLNFVCMGAGEMMGAPRLRDCYSETGFQKKLLDAFHQDIKKVVAGKRVDNIYAMLSGVQYRYLRDETDKLDGCTSEKCYKSVFDSLNMKEDKRFQEWGVQNYGKDFEEYF